MQSGPDRAISRISTPAVLLNLARATISPDEIKTSSEMAATSYPDPPILTLEQRMPTVTPKPCRATPETSNHRADASHRRWIKVSVDEDLFHHLHIVAAQSRMRITPFLRRYLAEAEPYQELFRR